MKDKFTPEKSEEEIKKELKKQKSVVDAQQTGRAIFFNCGDKDCRSLRQQVVELRSGLLHLICLDCGFSTRHSVFYIGSLQESFEDLEEDEDE